MIRVPLDVRLLRSTGLAMLVAAIGVTSPSPANAFDDFTELFSTTKYRDAANTTATWDTVTGRLHTTLFQPSLAGGVDTPGSALGVARVGTLAYVADGASGLEIYDVRDPANITLVGSLALPGTAYDVVVRGTVAYVADGTAGLKVVNVANPASPTLLATHSAGINVRGLAITGNTALLACDTGGLRLLSVSNPAAPSLYGTAPLSGNASGVAVSGLTAYVACGSAGVAIVSFSSPTIPTTLGTYNTPGNAVGIAVTNFRVYVADGASGVQILDATTASAVSLLGTFAAAGTVNGVTVNGTVLYVAADVAGLQVVNASNPASPVLLNACDTPGNANAVVAVNDLAFVADQASGLQVVRIGTLQRPRMGVPYRAVGGATPQHVTSVGNLVYTAGWQEMHIVDVSNHSGPTLVGFYRFEGEAFSDVVVSGPRAYIAMQNGGLHIVNVTNPASPVLWGSLPGFNGFGVAVSGAVAYVAAFSGGLKIISAGNPASPTLLSTYDTPGNAVAVEVLGTVAYVADQTSGLQIINVSNTSAPTLITTVPTPTPAVDVAISGPLAFVGTTNSGIQIVDISVPASAHVIGTYLENNYSFTALNVSGSTLYAFAGGLHVIDVSDPTAPVRIWNDLYGDPPISVSGAALSGSLIYAADLYNSRLQTLEVVQQRFDSTAAVGQSLPVNGGQWYDRMRLSSTVVDSVAWELSPGGGSYWIPVYQSIGYFTWVSTTRDLRWRATLHAVPPSVTAPMPEVSALIVDWDHSFARIDSLWDVQNDQGGKLRLRFERSQFEQYYFDPLYQVTGYEVYHRIDDPALTARILGEGARPDPASLGAGVPAVGASSVHRWEGRTFVHCGLESESPARSSYGRPGASPMSLIGEFPPGLWEALQYLPAFALEKYYALLPTTVDSTAEAPGWSVYFVAALTASPQIWFPSPPESAQSLDNLAPNVPTGFVAGYQPGGSSLHWNPSGAGDFRYFKVYRGNDPDFTPGPAFLVHSTIGTDWVDTSPIGGTVHYKLTAVDFAGNESPPASAVLVTGADGPVTPLRFALGSPMPNPFHGVMSIAFDVPAAGGRVEIDVYDIGGRRVRSVVDGSMTAGQWRVVWDGRDGHGRSLPSGVYLCRMRAAGFADVVKVALSK